MKTKMKTKTKMKMKNDEGRARARWGAPSCSVSCRLREVYSYFAA